MALLDSAQNSFTNGEVAPELRRRVDLQKFYSSLSKCENFYILPQGGVSNRTGLMVLGAVKDKTTKVRMIPFQFNTTDSYILEFGDYYCRFWTELGYVVVTGTTTPYEISTPFSEDDLQNIQYEQIADIMYIAWGGKPKTLTRYGANDWRIEEYVWNNGPLKLNLNNEKGWISYETADEITTIYLNSNNFIFKSTDIGRLFALDIKINPFSISELLSTTGLRDNLKTKTFFCGSGIQIQTSGTWDGVLNLEYTKNGVDWIVYKTFVSSSGSANYDFSDDFSDEPLMLRLNADGVTNPGPTSLTVNLTSDNFKFKQFLEVVSFISSSYVKVLQKNGGIHLLSFIYSSFETESYTFPTLTSNTSHSDEITVLTTGITEDTTDAYKAINGVFSIPEIYDINMAYTWDTSKYFGINFVTKIITNCRLRLYARRTNTDPYYPQIIIELKENGVWTVYDILPFTNRYTDWSLLIWYYDIVINRNITGIRVSASDTSIFIQNWYGLQLSECQSLKTTGNKISDLYSSQWNETDGYPTTVTTYQDRLCWGKGYTINASKTGQYNDFEIGTPITDNDAISTDLRGIGVQDINALVGYKGLVAYTPNADFITRGEVFTPTNFVLQQQNNEGSSNVKPALLGNNIIYALPLGSGIRDFSYMFESDGYGGDRLDLMSNHIFKGKVVKQFAYTKEPNSLLYVLFTDGTLAVLTYMKEQEVIGWSRYVTDGVIESIASIRSGGYEYLFAVVERENDKFIERLVTRNEVSLSECNHLDCSQYIENTAVCGITSATIVKETFETQITEEGTYDFTFRATLCSAGLGAHESGHILGISNPVVDKATFETQITTTGMHWFEYADGAWDRDLAQYGITYDGSPNEGDCIIINYIKQAWYLNAPLERKTDYSISQSLIVSLADYGITITGTPNNLDTIRVVYTEEEITHSLLAMTNSIIENMDYLEDETITAVLDGIVYTGLVVNDYGNIVLPLPATKIVVGIPYTSEISTLSANFNITNGTTQDNIKAIIRANIYFLKSYGGKVFVDNNIMETIVNDTGILYDGSKQVILTRQHDRETIVTVQQPNPFPMTITNIVLGVKI